MYIYITAEMRMTDLDVTSVETLCSGVFGSSFESVVVVVVVVVIFVVVVVVFLQLF